MSNVDDFKDHLTRALEQTGVVDKLRASIRREMLSVVNNRDGLEPPSPSPENYLINQLILEYLSFNGYRETLSVMRLETGAAQQGQMEREVLAKQLGLDKVPQPQLPQLGAKPLPLVYSLVGSAVKHGPGQN